MLSFFIYIYFMQEFIAILGSINEHIHPAIDFSTTIYESYEDLAEDLEIFEEELAAGNKDCVDDLYIHFLDNCTFNNLAIANGWEAEFKVIQAQFMSLVK